MSNTITAYFKGRVGVAESVYQNDYGIVMIFDSIELPAHFDCYFSVPGSDTATAAVGADNRVVIPSEVLALSGAMAVHIPLHTGENDSEVEYVAYFKVIGRARPEDDGTPIQMTAIEQALALLQNPITNIEQIVNEALSFTGDTFAEMKQELLNDFGDYTDTLEGGLATWKAGVESDVDDIELGFSVLQGQFDTAVAAVTTDTEVTDIRVGADGITGTSAGASVRRQFTNAKNKFNGLEDKCALMGGYNNDYRITFSYSGTTISVGVPQLVYYAHYVDGYYTVATINNGTALTFDVPAGSGLIYDMEDSEFSVKTADQIRALTHKYYLCFINSQGTVIGNWQVIANKDTLRKGEKEQRGYANAYYYYLPMAFAIDGNDVKVTFPSQMYALWFDANGDYNFQSVNTSSLGTVTVPHNSGIIFDTSTKTFLVKTITEIQAYANHYIVCMINQYGTINGQWNYVSNILSLANVLKFANARAGFVLPYSDAYEFKFAVSGTSIIVTLAESIYAGWFNANGVLTNYIFAASGTITVPHASGLIFDVSTKAFLVKTFAEIQAYSAPFVLCFINSQGTMLGQWRTLKAQSSQSTKAIPSYYEAHMESKESLIRERCAAAGFNGSSFVFITDIHRKSNAGNSASLLQHIASHTPIRTMVLGGDYYNEESSKASAYDEISNVLGTYSQCGMDIKALAGNHEYNNPGSASTPEALAKQLTEAEVYGILVPTMKDIVVADDSCSFYFDDTIQKIRYFATTCDYGSGGHGMEDYFHWVFTEMQSVPNGYDVLVFSHSAMRWQDDAGYSQFIVAAGQAFRNHSSSVTINGHTYDYSNTDGDFIALICGDKHIDTQYSSRDIVCVLTTTDCLEENSASSLERTAGEVSEQAFDCVTIDRYNKIMYMTRVGAGTDRIFHYGEKVITSTESLTSMLSGSLTWASDNSDVATVSSGSVTAVASGCCLISATDSNGTTEFWNILVR